MPKWYGGGHEKVGTCQIPLTRLGADLKGIVSKIKKDG